MHLNTSTTSVDFTNKSHQTKSCEEAKKRRSRNFLLHVQKNGPCACAARSLLFKVKWFFFPSFQQFSAHFYIFNLSRIQNLENVLYRFLTTVPGPIDFILYIFINANIIFIQFTFIDVVFSISCYFNSMCTNFTSHTRVHDSGAAERNFTYFWSAKAHTYSYIFCVYVCPLRG